MFAPGQLCASAETVGLVRAHSGVWSAAGQLGGFVDLGWALSHVWSLAETTELVGLRSSLQQLDQECC